MRPRSILGETVALWFVYFHSHSASNYNITGTPETRNKDDVNAKRYQWVTKLMQIVSRTKVSGMENCLCWNIFPLDESVKNGTAYNTVISSKFLWKGSFRIANHPKLCGNCAFP